jgi:RNA polymerase sigma-70 factor (ECF subfamily)
MTATEFRFKLVTLQDSLRRFAYSLTADHECAQDLVQETFLKALNNSEKFAIETSMKAWTFTIMKNTYINEYRRNLYNNIYRKDRRDLPQVNDTIVAQSDDPASTYSALEITENIKYLKESLQVPLQLRIKGYKYKEIADELNMNIGTVKSRIFLSRKQLVDLMNR